MPKNMPMLTSFKVQNCTEWTEMYHFICLHSTIVPFLFLGKKQQLSYTSFSPSLFLSYEKKRCSDCGLLCSGQCVCVCVCVCLCVCVCVCVCSLCARWRAHACAPLTH